MFYFYFITGVILIGLTIYLTFFKKMVYTAMTVLLFAILFNVLTHANYDLSRGYIMVKAMFKYHRLEYYNHRKAKIALLLTTYSSMMILFVLITNGFFTTFCMAAKLEWHNDGPESYAFYDLTENSMEP